MQIAFWGVEPVICKHRRGLGTGSGLGSKKMHRQRVAAAATPAFHSVRSILQAEDVRAALVIQAAARRMLADRRLSLFYTFLAGISPKRGGRSSRGDSSSGPSGSIELDTSARPHDAQAAVWNKMPAFTAPGSATAFRGRLHVLKAARKPPTNTWYPAYRAAPVRPHAANHAAQHRQRAASTPFPASSMACSGASMGAPPLPFAATARPGGAMGGARAGLVRPGCSCSVVICPAPPVDLAAIAAAGALPSAATAPSCLHAHGSSASHRGTKQTPSLRRPASAQVFGDAARSDARMPPPTRPSSASAGLTRQRTHEQRRAPQVTAWQEQAWDRASSWRVSIKSAAGRAPPFGRGLTGPAG